MGSHVLGTAKSTVMRLTRGVLRTSRVKAHNIKELRHFVARGVDSLFSGFAREFAPKIRFLPRDHRILSRLSVSGESG